jgi:hypothetical protein
MIGLDIIDQLTGRQLGVHDVPCPICGPLKQAARSQRRAVLRVWRDEPTFATFYCARCGEHGFACDRNSAPPDPSKVAKARTAAAERDRAVKSGRLSKALWLWRARLPIGGSIAERYLREARGYGGPLPVTLGFLPARGEHPPSMIAAFGLVREVEPGVITIADSAVTGVHLTRLKPDGSGKAVFEDPDEHAKKMVGYSIGSPIVLSPPTDLLALGITEGIEDGLSVFEASGLGIWVAGSAARMPTLAEHIPSMLDCVTVFADDDHDGLRHAAELDRRARARGVASRVIMPGRALS